MKDIVFDAGAETLAHPLDGIRTLHTAQPFPDLSDFFDRFSEKECSFEWHKEVHLEWSLSSHFQSPLNGD